MNCWAYWLAFNLLLLGICPQCSWLWSCALDLALHKFRNDANKKVFLHGSGGTFLAKLAYFHAWQQTPVTKGIFNSSAFQCQGALQSSFCHTFHKKFISRAKSIWFLISKNNFTRESPWCNYIEIHSFYPWPWAVVYAVKTERRR